jgi:hypothetical protein
MALTPEGTPYVEASDLVAAYPAASLSLANRVDLVGVLPFADSTARGTAIPSPSDGQYSYLQDINSTQFWNGSAWVAAGGKVLQVVTGTTSTNVTSTSATFVDTNLTASITPVSASNKVLVMVNQSYRLSGSSPSGSIKIVRNSTDIWVMGASFALSSSGSDERIYFSMVYLDSPSSTSSTAYKTMFQRASGTVDVQSNSIRSEITLIEVAG